MTYLIVVLGTLLLLIAFVALTRSEARTGRRLFGATRARFDTKIDRFEFIRKHIDLSAFLREEIRRAVNGIGHSIAHLSLQAVRATERLLTRLVRHLRRQSEDTVVPRESTREFVKTLSDFKDNLKATHPDVDVRNIE